jgi:lipopolysaccharide export LptBFGC system permease protein LptF
MADSTTSERSPLPEGTIAVGLGLGINGLSAYVFIKLGSQALGDTAWAPLTALWTITFVLAPGFFLPLEQEIGRGVAAQRSSAVC